MPAPPAVALAYAPAPVATAGPRPGALPAGLLAIGVVSLLVGIVFLLTSGVTAYTLFDAYLGSVPPPEPPAPKLKTMPPADVTPHAGDYVAADGLKSAARVAVVAAVGARVDLPADRAIMLDRFLADAGRAVMPSVKWPEPGAAAAMPERAIAAAVRTAGSEPDVGDGGVTFFTTVAGRVGVGDTWATFVPAAGGRPLRMDRNTFTAADGAQRWSARAADEWLESLRAGYGAPLADVDVTGEQAAVLLRSLPVPADSTDPPRRPLRL